MPIKNVQFLIDPTNTRAILSIEAEDGTTYELVADLEQVQNLQKIAQFTANHISEAGHPPIGLQH
ncbi:MAG TPA: hypothetical protein VHS59_04005 [Bacillota bacterium]|nr:hypothetical protein [Bacillota bacterium]